MMRAAMVALLVSGCAGSGGGGDGDSTGAPDTVPATMPDFPAVEAGQFAALTGTNNEDYSFSGSWEAMAGQCQDPALTQVIVQGEGFGLVLLIGPSPSAEGLGEYEVVAGTMNIPDTATARVGVQLFSMPGRAHTFRGTEGTVEVARRDTVVSGQLAIRIQETNFLDTVFVAGAFEVPVLNAPDGWCQVVGRRGRAAGGQRRPVRSRGAQG